jgi:hypothetical protein
MDYYVRTTLNNDDAHEGGGEGIVEQFPTGERVT